MTLPKPPAREIMRTATPSLWTTGILVMAAYVVAIWLLVLIIR